MSKNTVQLASGHDMPLVGFGLWKVPKETAADTVYNVSFDSCLLKRFHCLMMSYRPSNAGTDSSTELMIIRMRKRQAKAFVVPFKKVWSGAKTSS